MPFPATSSTMCEMEHDGTDINGDEWYHCTVHGHLVLGDAPYCEGYEAPPYVPPADPDAGRDRLRDPSINFPQSAEEAAQAIVHGIRQRLFDGPLPTLDREYTTDAGLGHTRSQQQADWLNEQASLIRARVEDLLDQLDIRTRT